RQQACRIREKGRQTIRLIYVRTAFSCSTSPKTSAQPTTLALLRGRTCPAAACSPLKGTGILRRCAIGLTGKNSRN
ncbi:MAG: hypothetical protein WCD77_16260, partial [Acidobacteriaceae bacterium]